MKKKIVDMGQIRETALLRRALKDMAQQEILAALRDETLDADYERTLSGVQAHIARKTAVRRPRRSLRMAAVLAAVLVVFSGACLAIADLPERYFGNKMVVDGIINRKELYEATCMADFYINAAGELEMYQFRMENPRGVQDDAYGNADKEAAVTWMGKIAYIRYRTTERDADDMLIEKISYVPVSFAQSVIVHDDRVMLGDLIIEGGACGPAYDIDDGFRRITASLATETWHIENANSGAWYQQAFGNPGYAFDEDYDAEVAAKVSTEGVFTYRLADEPEDTVHESSVCRLELLDWWK